MDVFYVNPKLHKLFQVALLYRLICKKFAQFVNWMKKLAKSMMVLLLQCFVVTRCTVLAL